MWDESQVYKTWAVSPALPFQRNLFFLPWVDLRQELGSREAGEFHVNFGLCPLPQNLDNCFAFGDLTRLGPVAKVMCPPKFVLVLLEELRVTARSCSRSAFAHPRGSKPHSPWALPGLRREGEPRPLRARQLTVSCRAGRGSCCCGSMMIRICCCSNATCTSAVLRVLYVFLSSLNNPFTNEKIEA